MHKISKDGPFSFMSPGKSTFVYKLKFTSEATSKDIGRLMF